TRSKRDWSSDVCSSDLEGLGPARQAEARPGPASDIEAIYQALLLGLRDYVSKCGFAKVIVGLSGGIDSSLVATLAADALGAENVLGVSMPGPYSSSASFRAADT